MKKKISIFLLFTAIQGCSAMNYKPSNKKLDIEKFMGTWYVQMGRVTFLEEGAFNPTEIYEYNEKNKRIDITFNFNKGSLNGPKKTIGQKGFIQNPPLNTYWKVSPIWPLKFGYLVLDFDERYEWCAIGVPSGKYLWIMTRDKNLNESQIKEITNKVGKIPYPVDNLQLFKHN